MYNQNITLCIGIMFTELAGRMPLVTENTTIDQLHCIIKILNCGVEESILFDRYLRKHRIVLSATTMRSKSYTLANTASALRQKYTQWPTHLLEIVAHCLQLNPSNRKNADQLLNMDFFTSRTFLLFFHNDLEIKLMHDSMTESTDTSNVSQRIPKHRHLHNNSTVI